MMPAVLEQINTSISPMGIKKTALEMISLVEIFSLEKNIFPPVLGGIVYENWGYGKRAKEEGIKGRPHTEARRARRTRGKKRRIKNEEDQRITRIAYPIAEVRYKIWVSGTPRYLYYFRVRI
jgi:hypothetical protein